MSQKTNTTITPRGVLNKKLDRIAQLHEDATPDSAKKNTVKEEIVLEFAEHVRKQFVQLYPQVPDLLLSPANECGVPKFICSSIRPTLPPVRDLYDAPICARFISQLIRYEPLDPPTDLPRVLVSPAQTLAARAGDCLDMSVLLASLLLGAGYDAYVVIGTAPKWITLRFDGLSRATVTTPPDSLDRDAQIRIAQGAGGAPNSQKVSAAAVLSNNKYKPAPALNLESDFLKSQREAAAAKIAAEEKIASGKDDGFESQDESDEQELIRSRNGLPRAPNVVPAMDAYLAKKNAGTSGGGATPESLVAANTPADPLEGQRVHAWVLIREGKREVQSSYFIEPSTGSIYIASDAKSLPYLTVEMLFNHKNVWVNMQGMPLIPRQSITDDGTPLAAALRAALGVNAMGRGIAARGFVSAVATEGTQASSINLEEKKKQAGPVRPEMLSPYMAALAAMKQVQLAEAAEVKRQRKGTGLVEKKPEPKAAAPKGGKAAQVEEVPEQPEEDPADEEAAANVGKPFTPPPGAPTLEGFGAEYALANPRPPKPKVDHAAIKKQKEAAAAASAALAASTESNTEASTGEGVSSNNGEPSSSEEASNGEVNGEVATATGGEDPQPQTESAAPAAQAVIAPEEDSGPPPGSSQSNLRPSLASRPNTRGRQPGRLGAGPWKEVMQAQTEALQKELADILSAQEKALPQLHEMTWDLSNGNAFEHVLLPFDAPQESHGEEGGESKEDGTDEVQAEEAVASSPPTSSSEESTAENDEDEGEKSEEGEGKTENEARPSSSGAAAAAASGSGSRPSSQAGGTRKKPTKVVDKYAGLKIEKDGEHILDLPPSWSSPLIIDRKAIRYAVALHPKFGVTTLSYKSRTEEFAIHSNPFGLISRFTEYADAERLKVIRIVEVFSRRNDFLSKRIRRLSDSKIKSGKPITLNVTEEHFERGRANGLAIIIDEPGLGCDLYFHAGARIDGLLRRREIYGKKTFEYYSEAAPNRMWYRSVTFENPHTVPHHGKEKTKAHLVPLTVETAPKVESRVRKMAEKYRRDLSGSTPSYEDVQKLVFHLDKSTIEARYFPAAGCIARSIRVYERSSGAMEQKTKDPTSPSEPLRPYDVNVDFLKACNREKDCHSVLRIHAKDSFELLQTRAHEVQHVELAQTLFEIAEARAKAGVPLVEHEETKSDDLDAEPDFLLPFLLAAKCQDVVNPSEKEAKKAERDARAAFKERLGERAGIIQKRLDEENDKLLRRQQAFARNRDHSESAEHEFESFQAESNFRISILETRLERHNSLLPKALAELDQRLRADLRLQIVNDPEGYRRRMEEQ
jgi:hypothetical protein